MINSQSKIVRSWYMLYFTYGFIPIIVGLDKYFDVLANWMIYLNESIPHFLNMHSISFMHIIGIVEIIIGIIVFIRPIIGGYFVTAWLLLICINLITMGTHQHAGHVEFMKHYDVVLRDLAMAVGSYVLVLLTKELQKNKN